MKKFIFFILIVFLNANTVNDANDLCYEQPIATGGLTCKFSNEMSGGICIGGMGCGIKIPFRNIGDLKLYNVKVLYKEQNIGGSFGDHCEANPSGTCKIVHNIDMGIFGLLGNATEFNFSDPIEPDDEVSIESSSLMSIKCFQMDNLYAMYIKNGILYKGKIRPCGTHPLTSVENNLSAKCGVFANMFQVRNPCGEDDEGEIDIDNAGQTLDGSKNIIIQAPSNYLNTCILKVDDWIENQYQTCGEKGDCIASGHSGISLNIIYNNPPQKAEIDTTENDSYNTVEIENSNSNKNLYDNEYDEIKPANGGVKNYTVNFHVNNSLNINEIETTVGNVYNFLSNNPYNLKIIDFEIKSNGSGNKFITDNNLKNLQIYYFEQASESNISIKALNSIKINEFNVGGKSDVVLKAPYIDINHFEPTNNGDDPNKYTKIDIYADYIDIGKIKLPQYVILTIHPYTPGKKILMRMNQLTESSSSTILVSSGDYYINHEWDLPGTDNLSAIRAIDKNQKINIFLNHELSIGNNPGINSFGNNGDFGNNPAVNFKLFINGDFETGGGGTTINALIYTEGNIELGNPTYIRGALSASKQIKIEQGQFIYDTNITNEGWGECKTGVYTSIIGPFDAWDTNRNINDRNISTKIVNQEFNLTLASLNNQDNALQQDNIGDINVSIFDMISKERISDIKQFNTNSYKKTQKTFVIHRASRNARVGFLLCSNYNSFTKIHTLYNYSHCSGNIVDCNVSGLHFRRCFSTDNFAIRPYAFLIFGQNQYKRAGEDFNITIKAVDKTNYEKDSGTMNDIVGVSGYNENLNDLNVSAVFYTPTDAETKQMNMDVYKIKNDTNKARIAYCPDPGKFTIVNGNQFVNGEINTTMKYSESGILTLRVAEINGSEFAKVDEKDTPDSQRLIKPATFIINENNLSQRNLLLEFIPYKFVTDGVYNSTTGGFVYMNNINNSIIPKMAAFLEYNITAENKDGQKLLNYTKTCFPDIKAPKRNGLKLNTTFDLLLDADINTSDAASLNFANIDTNDNSHISLLHPNINLAKGNHHILQCIGPLNFNEGVGRVKLFFNIKKDYRHPKNEVNITVNDINTSTFWMNNAGATKIFIGKSLDKTINFRYGRIDVGDISGYGNEINTTFKYEYWTNKGWKLNKEHNSSIFGDVNKSSDYQNFINNQFDVNMNVHNIVNGEENVTLSTKHALPYSTKIHLSIPSWLWYHPLAKNYKNPSSTNLNCLTHPCFNVNFQKQSSGWGGIGSNEGNYSAQKRTTEINASTSKIKANKSEVRKLNW